MRSCLRGWREATGDMIIVRYADDFIVGFQHEADARRAYNGGTNGSTFTPISTYAGWVGLG